MKGSSWHNVSMCADICFHLSFNWHSLAVMIDAICFKINVKVLCPLNSNSHEVSCTFYRDRGLLCFNSFGIHPDVLYCSVFGFGFFYDGGFVFIVFKWLSNKASVVLFTSKTVFAIFYRITLFSIAFFVRRIHRWIKNKQSKQK